MHRFGFRGRRLSRLTSIVAATAVAATLAPVLTAAPAQAAPAFVAYHDQTAASHQDKWNTLPGQGYRPISLSVYGDPDAPGNRAVMSRGELMATNRERYNNRSLTVRFYDASTAHVWS